MLGSVCFAEVRKVPYPEVKVRIGTAYSPDPAFATMRTAFAEAAARKDAEKLYGLVGPTFVWTVRGAVAERFDMGRTATDNFKVVFGFRADGKDIDGGVTNGPYWETLAEFAADATYYQVSQGGNLVCNPTAAEIADEDLFGRARKLIEIGDEGADWYFVATEVAVTKAPDEKAAPIARLAAVAVPVLRAHPSAREGQPAPPATHVEILLPSGRTGWISASAVRPLSSDRLCYARTPSGDWKIVAFDQSED
jgi:hypothetical protein